MRSRSGFLWAYLIASIATVGLISLYVGRVQRSFAKGLIMLVVLALLYGLLYLILQLEDYALLAGAIAGLPDAGGGDVRHARVNWSGEATRQS